MKSVGSTANAAPVLHGGLFPPDYLQESVCELREWNALGEDALDAFIAEAQRIIEPFASGGASRANESHTEDDLIWPVLANLGWTASLRQQNLSIAGRADVPDGLLFADDGVKRRALKLTEGPARYAIGTALVESKRWLRPLDRASGRRGEALAPSSQMLRYLRRADDLTNGGLRWGILTNGAQWRLYWQGARSVANQFFEIDLAAALDLPGHNDGLFRASADERRHALKLFVLFFHRRAFSDRDVAGRNLHERTLQEGRYFEQRIAEDLSQLVFDRVFPDLAGAIARAAPEADLAAVRHAALVLLYRLLFILYAEDRSLLPVNDHAYANIGFRQRVREEVRRRKEEGQAFSETAASYYHALQDLARVIDKGDPAFGLPPYNGGLFDAGGAPLLNRIQLPNAVLAEVVDALSFEQSPAGGERRYINYRSLSVQQLGSIYERLLEHEVVPDAAGGIAVRPNIFARKGSGSYYTPDDLVRLLLAETVEPLVEERLAAFRAKVQELPADAAKDLAAVDPAKAILDLKICDPAMGSGHFLVNLVDLLSDRVIFALAEASEAPGYASPVAKEVAAIRKTITENAAAQGWRLDPSHLDDRQIVRRMVLKRCIYGVDKNPMAVELAKVSLWLHTFTVGAPLSFLDHHLRCGDSLFGCWVRTAKAQVEAAGVALFIEEPLKRALAAANPMRHLEALADAEIDEAERSSTLFSDIERGTAPLRHFLSVLHALDWLQPTSEDKFAVGSWLAGTFGDPVAIAAGDAPLDDSPQAARFGNLLEQARQLASEERFLHWQVTFPGVWPDWEDAKLADDGGRIGGFDAVIGNPPWDRMKMQQVEWFAARRPAIALAQRAAHRKRMIHELEDAGDPLGAEFQTANDRANAALRMARSGGDYPLLGRGDINLYSLFVERAMTLVKPDGVVGLLTPSGIASDKTAAPFFRAVATEGRLRTLYDFENRKVFFPHVHASFKFCAFVAGRSPRTQPAKCAFFLHSVSDLEDAVPGPGGRRFHLSVQDFARVNPNTGTAPIFRSSRDAQLTTAIYERVPVLVDRSGEQPQKTWPVKYRRMFDMTNDSKLFRTRRELEEGEGAWPLAGNRFDSPGGEWLPLYEGKMVQAYDHRAADVTINPANPHRPAQAVAATDDQHKDPCWSPTPQYWVSANADAGQWAVAFKDVTAPTNARSMIAAVIPSHAAGNTLPLLLPQQVPNQTSLRHLTVLTANLNAVIYDYLARQKIQGQHLNWYIVEQLPVVPPSFYEKVLFGDKTAAEIIRDAVLELTYTAHDMASFAKDLGYVDAAGDVKPPFVWNAERRLRLQAKLDALFFHLYGVTDREDIRYIYATFPIVERQQTAAYGRYRSRDLSLAWMNALAAGRPDAQVEG